MKNFFSRKKKTGFNLMELMLLIAVIAVFVMSCAAWDALQKKYNPKVENPECSLYADLGVSSGYIFDKIDNPCALPNGLVVVIRTGARFTKADAEDFKKWALEGIDYLDKGLNGKEFWDFVSDGVGKISGIVGKAFAVIGDVLKIIPKDAIVDPGSTTVLKYSLQQVADAMDELIAGQVSTKSISVEGTDYIIVTEDLKF